MATKGATVYRFRDKVAVNMPGGPTVYLPADTAAKVARFMGRVAKEIRDGVPFTESAVGTAHYEVPTDGQ